MKLYYIYITDKAKNLAEKINNEIKNYFLENSFNFDENKLKQQILSYKEFKEEKEKIFQKDSIIVFIMATGIVVRSISTLIKDKFNDPAVIVIDEMGNNVISLLSGHIGGANEYTELIAELINANPVITTATDVNNKGAFDLLVKKINGKVENFRDLSLKINSELLKNENIYLYIDRDYRDLFQRDKNNEKSRLLKGFTLVDNLEELIKISENKSGTFIAITDKICDLKKDIIIVIPQLNVLGVGCRRGTDEEVFKKVVKEYLDSLNINIESIKIISSIYIKSDEKCILEFADLNNLEKVFWDKKSIESVEENHEKSDFVKKKVGVFSVAEPCCHLLCNGNLIGKKYKNNGITISLGRIINI